MDFMVKRMWKAMSTGNFDTAFEPRENSFGFLRLLLASLVLYSHSFALTQLGPEPFLGFSSGRKTLGTVCVLGFFAISGFLITRSMVTSRSTLAFFWARFLRLFPAFWVCLLVTVLVFVPIFCWLEGRDLLVFLQDHGGNVLSYVYKNSLLSMKQLDIHPLLENAPYPRVVDGSLWSLALEWRCYIFVGLLGLIIKYRVFQPGYVLLTLLAVYASIVHAEALPLLVPRWFRNPQFTELSSYFLVGGLTKLLTMWVF